jgi:hypothetical protein
MKSCYMSMAFQEDSCGGTRRFQIHETCKGVSDKGERVTRM